ncbi:MAG: FKBP-type peptidyl-prolyl cis-trans isomerase [Bacteroidales bacterium]|jgi:FKBP-type peptidyl-prolyl cis-trans isomerase FkpA|nr:FKBP-type peptidyl-prolyl cis-trans isomerase [Bacteroidales bacterium]
MKKISFILLSFILAFSACTKDDSASEIDQEQLEIDKQLIEDYLADNNLTTQVTESGVYYIIDNPETGDNPDKNSTVTVEYFGKLLNGDDFDNNKATFSLSGVIQGWEEGIPLFKEGGQGKLYIPSGLAYGDQVKPNIPANSVLIFEIKLISIES